MKDLIKLQIFRVSVSLGILVSLLFFMVIAPNSKNVNSEAEITAEKTCDTQTADDKISHDPSELQTSIKKATKSKRNKLTTLIRVLKSILEEELKCTQIQESIEAIELAKETLEAKQATECVNATIEEAVCKDTSNKTFDCNKILERITAALERSKAFSTEKKTKAAPASLVPIFRESPKESEPPVENLSTKSQGQYLNPTNQLSEMPPIPMAKNDVPPTPMAKLVLKRDPNSQPGQSNTNPVPNTQRFIIPCQRVSDILDDSYSIPKGAYCNTNPNAYLRPSSNGGEYNFQQANVMPNAVSCKNDGTVAMLFKPKAISLMQVYGNLLKKLTVTVLVPYYVSTLAV